MVKGDTRSLDYSSYSPEDDIMQDDHFAHYQFLGLPHDRRLLPWGQRRPRVSYLGGFRDLGFRFGFRV